MAVSGLALAATVVAAEERDAMPTFTRDIASIVYENCSACHRPGESGPFDLLTYDDVRKRSGQIVAVARSGFMPPWLPESGYGEFAGERRLTLEQIDTLEAWSREGTPEGDARDLPPLPEWTVGWQLGEPDLIITMDEPYVLRASGVEVFRNFVIPTPVESQKYVRALELRPGNPKVVHHAIMRTDETRSSRLQASLDPEPGFGDMNMGDAVQPDGYLLGWTPGNQPDPGADGFAWTLRPDTDFVLQLHLQPSGKQEPVQSQVGFHFADEPPDRQIANIMLRARGIDIPAGESHHLMTDRYTIPVDVDVVSIYPHAHYLGKQFEGWAELPDGSKQWLVKIDDWDFNWQDEYRYEKPVRLPAGTTVFMNLVFDNSANNVRNPHSPPQRVLEGPRSVDEMGTLTLQVVPKDLVERDALRQALANQDVKKDPENWLHHDNLATLAHDAGRIEEAIGHYRETLRLNSTRTEALINLGSILVDSGEVVQAQDLLGRALDLNPGSARAHLSYGRLQQARGDLEAASRHYSRSVELQPGLAEAHGSLAQLYAGQGRLDDASRHYELGLAASPESAELHNNLGNLRFMQQRPAEAVRAYRRSLELAPRQAEAHNNLANALFYEGRLDDAIEHFRAALEIDPGLQDTSLNLKEALGLRAERDATVEQARRRIAAAGGRDPGAWMMLADVYAGYGQIDEALKTADQALKFAGANVPMAERIRRQTQRYRELLPPGGE